MVSVPAICMCCMTIMGQAFWAVSLPGYHPDGTFSLDMWYVYCAQVCILQLGWPECVRPCRRWAVGCGMASSAYMCSRTIILLVHPLAWHCT